MWRDTLVEIQKFKSCEFVHVKREWDAAADLLATKALQGQSDSESVSTELAEDLKTLNRLDEVILIEDPQMSGISVQAVSTRHQRRTALLRDPGSIANLRIDRIRMAQAEEGWIRE
jgi:hypothetical protein